MGNKTTGKISQVKYGAIISYILIIGNAVFGLLVTPFILESVGNSDYGVYKSIGAFVSSMLVMDFGISGTLMRYISKYKSEKEDGKINNFISMMAAETGVLLCITTVVLTVLYFCLDIIYSKEFTPSEMALAKKLFLLQGVLLLLHMVSNFINGIITGHNNFLLGNGTKLVKLIVKIVLTYVLLNLSKNVLLLVVIEMFITVTVIIVESVYIKKAYCIKLNLQHENWDKSVLKESFVYTFYGFLTSIAAQVNNNLDNIFVGAFCGSVSVTIYSFGLVIFLMYEQLSTAISSVMLPTVTRILHSKDGEHKIQDTIVQAGRMQFMLLAAVVVGFFIIGKDFLNLWIGERIGDAISDVYIITLILMVPSLFELCVNVCLAVLRAKNMIAFRTKILTLSTVLNAVVTVVGVMYFGYIAAAVGTALSFIVGSLIVMNIYYKVKLGFPMLKIYGRIVNRIWVCLALAGTALFASSRFIGDTWIEFVANVSVFAVVYAVSLLLYGFSKEERKRIPIINKFFK